MTIYFSVGPCQEWVYPDQHGETKERIRMHEENPDLQFFCMLCREARPSPPPLMYWIEQSELEEATKILKLINMYCN